MARICFTGAEARIKGYVNHIGAPRDVGQNRVMEVLVGWTAAPRKNETEGRRQTVKGSIWSYSTSQKDELAQFLNFVKKGDVITIYGSDLELDTYDKRDGATESMMKITIDKYEPVRRSNNTANENGHSQTETNAAAADRKGYSNGTAGTSSTAAIDDSEVPF